MTNEKIKIILQDLLENDEDYDFCLNHEKEFTDDWMFGKRIEGNFLELTYYCDLHFYFIFYFKNCKLTDIKVSSNCDEEFWNDPEYFDEEELQCTIDKIKELKSKINSLLK